MVGAIAVFSMFSILMPRRIRCPHKTQRPFIFGFVETNPWDPSEVFASVLDATKSSPSIEADKAMLVLPVAGVDSLSAQFSRPTMISQRESVKF